MIVFRGQGGLGNQLFQYAAARNVASRSGEELVVDHHWFGSPRPGETPRQLELLRYNVRLRLATAAELKRFAILRSRASRLLGPVLPMRIVRELGDERDFKLLSDGSHMYLCGFWQSEDFFAGIRGMLLQELTPLAPPSELDLAILDQMSSVNAVSVHVRRGDYVTLPTAAAYHGTCSLHYYKRAIAYIAERIADPVFYVFSDDPAWVKENLRTQYRMVVVDHNSGPSAFQDLRLMAACKHNIIANSSFSWWGAWLGDPNERIVVAPNRWFAGGAARADLLPGRWVKL